MFLAVETYGVIEYLNFVGIKKFLDTLNDRFKICTDTVRVVEISVGRCVVHLNDGESVFLDGELILAPSHTGYLDTLALFDMVVGCWDSVVRDIFELVWFLMLIQIVSGEEKHGRFDYGHCAVM